MKSNDGRIVMPDGSYIPRFGEGKNLMEKLDAYYRQSPVQPVQQQNGRDAPPHATSMWFSSYNSEPAASSYYAGATVEEVLDEDSEDTYVLVNEGAPRRSSRLNPERTRVSDKARPVERQRPPPGPPKAVPAPRSPTPPVQQSAHPSTPAETDEEIVKTIASPATRQQGSWDDRTEFSRREPPPQFQFHTPIEDPKVIEAILQRSMETKFLISQNELLSLSRDLRKQYKDLVSTKRIPMVGLVETADPDFPQDMETSYVLRYENNEETLLTASPLESLRTIHPVVNGLDKVECVLDQGSEIIAMNKGLWQELGVHMEREKAITMEAANSSKNFTAGLVEDLKFTIGGIDLFLQVQVVDNAPFEILIGRPFFRLTSCTTQDYADGTQDLTITCPNTGRCITIPTTPKKKKNSPSVGFLPIGSHL